jgi:branched-chain amino acid transport system permease protein
LLLVSYFLKKSKYGLFLAAIADDEDAAQANGVNVLECKLKALIISAFFSALGGTFYAQFYRFIDPQSILSVPLSIEIVLIAIVGGSRFVWGPVLGAIILTPLGEIVRMYLGGTYAGIHRAIYGLVLVLVILFLPDGLASIPVKIINKIKEKKANVVNKKGVM